MTTLNEVKELALKAGNISQVKVMGCYLSQILESSDSAKVEKLLSKKEGFCESAIVELNRAIKKNNRTLHKFESASDLDDFEKANDCGEMWVEGIYMCVYSY